MSCLCRKSDAGDPSLKAGRGGRSVWWVCLLFFLAALPLILFPLERGRAYHDQQRYHLPAIRHFAGGGGLREYPSATTPGYHWLMAQVYGLSDGNRMMVQVAGSVFTVVFLGLWVRLASRRFDRDSPEPLILALPVLSSLYIFPAGVWLLPDNLAWCIALPLFALMCGPEWSVSKLWMAGGLLLMAVAVRQNLIWLILPLASRGLFELFRKREGDLPRGMLVSSLLSVMPALLLLGGFVALWGGVVPPSFAGNHVKVNTAAPAFLLAVTGFYGLFYLSVHGRGLMSDLRSAPARRQLILGAVMGLGVALIPETSWSPEAGRVSGLWNLARLLPEVSERSVVIVFLAMLGGGVWACWLRMARGAHRLVLLVSFPAFALVLMVNQFVYERYIAGFLFIVVALNLHLFPSEALSSRRMRLAGPVLFAVFNLGVLVWSLGKGVSPNI